MNGSSQITYYSCIQDGQVPEKSKKPFDDLGTNLKPHRQITQGNRGFRSDREKNTEIEIYT